MGDAITAAAPWSKPACVRGWRLGNMTVLDPPERGGDGDAPPPAVRRMVGPHFWTMGVGTYVAIVGCTVLYLARMGPLLPLLVNVGVVAVAGATLAALTLAATTDPGVVRPGDAGVHAAVSGRQLAAESFLPPPPGATGEDLPYSSGGSSGGARAVARSGTTRALASTAMGVPGARRVVRFASGGTASRLDGTFCEPCGMVVPDAAAAVHCDLCGVCIRGHDHHCPWVGQCIGDGNMTYFWAFLVSLAVTMTYMMFAAILMAAASDDRTVAQALLPIDVPPPPPPPPSN